MPETLVLLHGFSGTHRAWDEVIDRLDTQRYRPLALDLPGHGGQADHRWPMKRPRPTRIYAGCRAVIRNFMPGN